MYLGVPAILGLSNSLEKLEACDKIFIPNVINSYALGSYFRMFTHSHYLILNISTGAL